MLLFSSQVVLVMYGNWFLPVTLNNISACSSTICSVWAWKKKARFPEHGIRKREKLAVMSFSNHVPAKEINQAPSSSLSVWLCVTQEKGWRKQIVCMCRCVCVSRGVWITWLNLRVKATALGAELCFSFLFQPQLESSYDKQRQEGP